MLCSYPARVAECLLQMTATVRAAATTEWSAVKHLLEQASLPTDDLNEAASSYFSVYADDSEIKGVIAMQPLTSEYSMLRSLVVTMSARGKGIGHVLVESIEAQSRARGIAEVFLLTTSADRFFAQLGYEVRSRDSVPNCVKEHDQFRTLCPASAILMSKRMTV